MEKGISQKAEYTLKKYMQLLHNEMGDMVYGVYIYGSAVLGSFNEKNSDIDFLTVLKRELSSGELERLKDMHKKLLTVDAFSSRLEGEYVCLNDLRRGKLDRCYPYFADGKYQGSIKVRKIALLHIRQYGITLYGNSFEGACEEVDWEEIRDDLGNRLNNYWLKKSKNRLLLFDGWASLIVLTICRIYYTLEYHTAIAKNKAGERALEELPEEWHTIIREALRISEGSSDVSLYSTKLQRFKEIKRYAEYIRDMCNEKYNFLFV